ncbi:PTS lactose/cellobiose transporter subunit IIA [Streptococcus sp. 121]|uniref:PTS lactose/cellobiose transporter subunit IIA n=1 Tax=Streptococcus sp. 121 TaxID=2797637 RepID=UPI0018F10775|nr:PTS lactose/cellobiose transporter subunit IIA [Streptococcus sp. 121]MBJ6745602.1 PTS lactose/cellobiose transporter subunit IIA [Streptococcus sp. 121]
MDTGQHLEAIMGLIMYGGEAKGYAVQAIQAAKKKEFEEADRLLAEATKSLNVAHNSQTDLLAKEAGGQNMELTLLMVHGQDHLMTALTFIDLAKEFVDVYKQMALPS